MSEQHQILQTIALSLVDRLHLRQEDANEIAEQIFDELVMRFGGDSPYIPAKKTDVEKRNERIRREFDGRNHSQLAERYRLSVRTIYRILGKKPGSR